jgi:hypothetical protein
MKVAVFSIAFLYVATILGLFLKPTDAEVQAKNFVPPTDAQGEDHGHDHADHGSHHGH